MAGRALEWILEVPVHALDIVFTIAWQTDEARLELSTTVSGHGRASSPTRNQTGTEKANAYFGVRVPPWVRTCLPGTSRPARLNHACSLGTASTLSGQAPLDQASCTRPLTLWVQGNWQQDPTPPARQPKGVTHVPGADQLILLVELDSVPRRVAGMAVRAGLVLGDDLFCPVPAQTETTGRLQDRE